MITIQYIDYKWLDHPEQFYPEPRTIVNCIKWHIALTHKESALRKEANKHLQGKSFYCLGNLNDSPEADAMYIRDMQFISSLGYINVARMEAAMQIGRELYYKKHHTGYSEYDEELSKYKLSDLDTWMKVFDIPPSIAEGGNIEAATEYTLGKIPDFLQAYVDALEGSD